MVWTLPADNHMRITWVTKHRRLLAKRRARSRVLRKPRALKLRRMVKHLDQQQEDPPHEKLKAKHAAPHVAGPADDSDMHLDDETLVLGGIFTSFYIVLGECLGDRLTVSGLHRSCRVSH